MKILRMEQADLQGVEKLAIQLGYPVGEDEIGSRFAEISVDPDYALFVARMEDGSVLGYIQINREPKSLLISDYADVAALIVDDQHRSKGLGKLLINEAEIWARENKIKLIRIRSNSKRTEAQRFYSREGYHVAKLSNIFTKRIG